MGFCGFVSKLLRVGLSLLGDFFFIALTCVRVAQRNGKPDGKEVISGVVFQGSSVSQV